MTTTLPAGDTRNNIARLKKTSQFARDEPGTQKMAPGVNNFANFRFQKSANDGLIEKKVGLTDVSNVAAGGHPGYINKIRRGSVSGKEKEQKKIALVTNHTNKVGFKPALGRKQSFREKKPFSVPVPEHSLNVDELSPMDTDAPLLRIRNLMTRVPHGVADIDAISDPLKCSTYAQDICDYLQAIEQKYSFPKNYLVDNKEVTPHMRAVLVDWLIQVQVHQELSQHTLQLCVTLIDRFLCEQHVQLSVLQLVGITSMLVSAKFHERFPPDISDLCHLTDGTYTPGQVLKMERLLLRKLDFNLNCPSPSTFVDRFLLIHPCDKNQLIQSMAMFLIDLTLTEVCFVHFVPSLLGAGAIYVARGLLGCDPQWGKAFAHYTKYSEKDLSAVSTALKRLLAKMKKSKFTGAHGKYSHSSFHGISNHSSLRHITLHPSELWPEDHDDNDDTAPTCHETLII